MARVRAMFTDIFLNFTSDPQVSAAAIEAGKQFRAYVEQLIGTLKSKPAQCPIP